MVGPTNLNPRAPSSFEILIETGVDAIIREAADDGRLKAVTLPRWADPDGRGFRYVDFGALAEEEATFDGYTIATRLRVGYYPGTARFESEGEFFRVTIDHASYR